MKETVKLFFKGFAIGISNLIPGVSGGTVAVIVGIYEKFIYSLGHLFNNFKKNAVFLLPVILGMVFSIVSLSGVISFCLNNYLFATILFFCGAIAGGIPKTLEPLKGSSLSFGNITSFVLAFIIVALPLFFKGNDIETGSITALLFIKLIIMGFIASATMVIPGISGSAVLMALGYYHYIIDNIHALSSPSAFSEGILVVAPYAIGLVLGLFLSARAIESCLKKHPVKSFYAINGFVVSSILVILIQNNILKEFLSAGILNILAAALLFVIGFFITTKLGD